MQSGGEIIFATDDYFATADNLIEDSEPVFIEDKYTEYGKWMDGWETRRKRIPGHDWCIIKLVASCNIKGILVDTAFFKGNFAPRISLQGGNLTEKEKRFLPHRQSQMGTASSNEENQLISQLNTESWPEIIPMTRLKPGFEQTRKNYFAVSADEVFSYIRVNIYPDAGMARLRVFGTGVPDLSKFNASDVFDLIAMENGGAIVSYSNAYFSHPKNLIKIGRATRAGDGWETMRRLDRPPILEEDSNGFLKVPGSEWTIIKMSCSGIVSEVVIDILHFIGNAPYSVKIEGIISNSEVTETTAKWETILHNQKLTANDDHFFKADKLAAAGPFTHVKITIFPDGGMSRFRVFGRKTG